MTAKSGFAGLTIDAARRELSRIFSGAGLETPALDARLLVGSVLVFAGAPFQQTE